MSRLAPYRLHNGVLLDGLQPDFEHRLYALLTDERLQHKVHIVSGFRTRAQQQDLYDRWRAGTYNVPSVARPGTSRHESGRAADLGIGWGATFGWTLVHQVASKYGLHFPVRGEAWHVETKPGAPPLEETMTPEQDRMLRQIHRGMFQGLNPDVDAIGYPVLATNYVVQNALTVDGKQPFLPGQLRPSPPVDVAALVNVLAPMLVDAMKHDGPLELSVIEAAVTQALSKVRFTAA